jgi:hypothetical protein
MKTVVAAALLLSAAAPLWAQGPDQETLKANLKKKLDAAFVAKAAWITDYDKAREESKKSGKAIFSYFTRSYAN